MLRISCFQLSMGLEKSFLLNMPIILVLIIASENLPWGSGDKVCRTSLWYFVMYVHVCMYAQFVLYDAWHFS